MKTSVWIVLAAACFTAAACADSKPQADTAPPPAQRVPIGQLPEIDMTAVLAHTKTLSSDAFEGRAPGTPGEEKTVAFLTEEFKKAGLKPGNTNGTYVQ